MFAIELETVKRSAKAVSLQKSMNKIVGKNKYFFIKVRPLQNTRWCSRSRNAKILTGVIRIVFRGLKSEPDAEIAGNSPLWIKLTQS